MTSPVSRRRKQASKRRRGATIDVVKISTVVGALCLFYFLCVLLHLSASQSQRNSIDNIKDHQTRRSLRYSDVTSGRNDDTRHGSVSPNLLSPQSSHLNSAKQTATTFTYDAAVVRSFVNDIDRSGKGNPNPSKHDGSPCQVDADVLSTLARQGLIETNNYNRNVSRKGLLKSYGKTWTAQHTCFLLNQLLITEALGGYHPHCSNHAQNRNLQYALLKHAGTIRPSNLAIEELGRVLGKYDFSKGFASSDQLLKIRSNAANVMSDSSLAQIASVWKGRMLQGLRGPGISMLEPVGKDWLNNIFESLRGQTFIHRQSGRTVKGFSPDEVIKRGWHGSFWLKDLQSPFDIPEVRQIAYDPFILDTLQDLMGVPPILRACDISFNVAPTEGDADPADYSFTTWHKDFNTIRTAKVFVYLSDALEDWQGPHTFFPYTHDAMGEIPIIEQYPQSMSAQNIPMDYIQNAFFPILAQKVHGTAGTVWMEDTHVFHKADMATKGWRGLLQLDYTATGFGGKDHTSLYDVFSRIPSDEHSAQMHRDYPRLFQRAIVGEYANPSVPAPSSELLQKAKRLEEVFGKLQYDSSATDPSSHQAYVQAGFADKGLDVKHASWDSESPCWEHQCSECLKDSSRGTCEICSNEEICTCSCAPVSDVAHQLRWASTATLRRTPQNV